MSFCSIPVCRKVFPTATGAPDSEALMNSISWDVPPALTELLLLDCHKACVDCGVADTEWASLGFGVLVCLKCAGFHRSLGTHITSVRAVKLDSWTDAHVQFLRLGGNAAFKQHCSSVMEQPSDAPAMKGATKYGNARVLYYR
jgi:hypothetical protein